MHAYVDENNYNTQNLNAKEITMRLNPEKYEISLFYRSVPDQKLVGKDNIKLIKVPSGFAISSLFLVSKLLGNYDIFFYFRCFKVDKRYIIARKFFRDRKRIFFVVENRVSKFNKERIRYGLLSSNYKYSISQEVANSVKKTFNLNTKVIHVGVDTKKFKPKQRKNSNKQNILFVGTLCSRKRPQVFLELAKYFPTVNFHLIGSGPLENILINKIKKTSNVFFHGRVSLETLIEYMQNADLFVLPSLEEGFGKVTMEAQATGTPPIIFDSYGSEAIINGKTGFAVKNFGELLDKTKRLLDDDDLRIKMGKNARKFSIKYDWNPIVKQWDKEFEIARVNHVRKHRK